MNIVVSNLPYQGLFTNRLISLPENIGIEVYSESGSEFYWDHLLPKLFDQRTGKYAVHGPYQNIDLSSPKQDFESVFNFFVGPLSCVTSLVPNTVCAIRIAIHL